MSAAQATSSDRLYYCTNTVTQRRGAVKPNGSGLTVSRSLIPAVGHRGHASRRQPGHRWPANSTHHGGAGQVRPMRMASYRRLLRTLRTAAASFAGRSRTAPGPGRDLGCPQLSSAALSCPQLPSVVLILAGGVRARDVVGNREADSKTSGTAGKWPRAHSTRGGKDLDLSRPESCPRIRSDQSGFVLPVWVECPQRGEGRVVRVALGQQYRGHRGQ